MIYIKGKGYETEAFLTWGEVAREAWQWECLKREHRMRTINDMAFRMWNESPLNEKPFLQYFKENIKTLLVEAGWEYEEI